MPTSKSKMPHTAFIHHLYVLVEYNKQFYLEKMYVEEALNNKETEVFSRVYTLKDRKSSPIPNSVLCPNGGLTGGISATKITIADLFTLVKAHNPEFTPKPTIKAVNKDSPPKIYYHGTNSGWNVYDLQKRRNEPLYMETV